MQIPLFRDKVHGFEIEEFSETNANHTTSLKIKRLASRPTLPTSAIWESHQHSLDDIPQTRLYQKNNQYLMEISCQGKGVFIFEKETNLIEVYWESRGTGFQHYLLTTGMALALELKGILCLHGNTLIYNGKGFGLLGESTAGKSTLSAALAQAGCQIMSDDMLTLQFADDQWRASSSIPGLRLWQDSLVELFGSNVLETTPRVHEAYDKYSIDAGNLEGQWLKNSSQVIATLYILDRRDDSGETQDCKIEEMSASDALISLIRESVLSDATKVLGLETLRLRKLSQVLSYISVKRLTYPSGFQTLPDVCDTLLLDLN